MPLMSKTLARLCYFQKCTNGYGCFPNNDQSLALLFYPPSSINLPCQTREISLSKSVNQKWPFTEEHLSPSLQIKACTRLCCTQTCSGNPSRDSSISDVRVIGGRDPQAASAVGTMTRLITTTTRTILSMRMTVWMEMKRGRR